LLFCEAAAVPVAVYEGKYGRNLLFSRPLQALEKTIPTAEYFHAEKRTQIFTLGNVLKILFTPRPFQEPERLISTAEQSHPGKRTQKKLLFIKLISVNLVLFLLFSADTKQSRILFHTSLFRSPSF